MRKTSLAVALAGVAALTAFAAAPAQAAPHGRTVSVQGSAGHGYTRSRQIDRQPGSTSATGSFQANDGQGVTSSRSAAWGGGTYQGGATHAFNDGTSSSRSTNVVRNGDGSVGYDVSHTGRNGQTNSVSGTVTGTITHD